MTAEIGWETGLGKAIELIRTELGMSRKDLAGLAGISYPFLSEIEKGVKQPSSRKLGQLAEALGLETEELVELSKRKATGEHFVRADSVRMSTERAKSAAIPEEISDRETAVWAASTGPEVEVEADLETDRTSRSGVDDRRALDAEIKEAVNVAVSDTLRIWSRDVLPLLVEREVERALAAEHLGEDG